MDPAVAFLDTNVLLHYRRVKEIDWQKVLGCGTVRLVIAPCVLRELDKHKETHHLQKIRRRAADVLAELDVFLDQGPGFEPRSGIQLEFLSAEPQVDWAACRLRSDVPDDQLIASLLIYRQERGGVSILVTADAALKVKAKARGIPTAKPGDDQKLTGEETPEEKRIREMDAELKSLRAQRPKLTLLFSGGGERMVAKLKPTVAPDRAAIAAAVEKLRKEHPPLEIQGTPPKKPPQQKDTPLSKALGLDLSSLIFSTPSPLDMTKLIKPEEIKNYHDKLEGFFIAHERYLENLVKWQDARHRTIRIQLEVRNDGGAPAEDVVIKMHFPDGFQLCDADKLAPEPEPPEAPEKPFPFGSHPSLLDPGTFLQDIHRSALSPRVFAKSNVSSNSIRQTKSYDVKTSVAKINHGFAEFLDPMFATFRTHDDARSFAITYEIHAANLPAPEKGELQIVVNQAGGRT